MGDREVLTRRFKEVFENLESRGLVDQRNTFSVHAFAKNIGTSSEKIFEFLTLQDHLTKSQAFRFASKYDCEDFMFKGISNYLEELSSEVGNIVHIPWKIFAGSPSVEDLVEKGTRYIRTDIHGEAFSFDVEGNSMEPEMFAGDRIFCKRLESVSDAKKNKVYVIITKDKKIVKRLRMIDEKSANSALIFSSDNSKEFPELLTYSGNSIEFIFEVFKMERTF